MELFRFIAATGFAAITIGLLWELAKWALILALALTQIFLGETLVERISVYTRILLNGFQNYLLASVVAIFSFTTMEKIGVAWAMIVVPVIGLFLLLTLLTHSSRHNAQELDSQHPETIPLFLVTVIYFLVAFFSHELVVTWPVTLVYNILVFIEGLPIIGVIAKIFGFLFALWTSYAALIWGIIILGSIYAWIKKTKHLSTPQRSKIDKSESEITKTAMDQVIGQEIKDRLSQVPSNISRLFEMLHERIVSLGNNVMVNRELSTAEDWELEHILVVSYRLPVNLKPFVTVSVTNGLSPNLRVRLNFPAGAFKNPDSSNTDRTIDAHLEQVEDIEKVFELVQKSHFYNMSGH